MLLFVVCLCLLVGCFIVYKAILCSIDVIESDAEYLCNKLFGVGNCKN